MRTLFVASSGTGIGKTLVTAALAWQLRGAGLRVRAIKPVISGYTPETQDESDTAVILRSLGLPPGDAAVDAISPWRFRAPLSPDMAAAREGKTVDFDALLAFCRDCQAGEEDVLLIEGIGGVMVPLTDAETVLDWMTALAAPAAIVVGSYLGTISHTLTAVEAVRRRDIPMAGVIISESAESPVPMEETRATLRHFLGTTPIAMVPRLPLQETPWTAAPDLRSLLALE